jgi:hypothetical protein
MPRENRKPKEKRRVGYEDYVQNFLPGMEPHTPVVVKPKDAGRADPRKVRPEPKPSQPGPRCRECGAPTNLEYSNSPEECKILRPWPRVVCTRCRTWWWLGSVHSYTSTERDNPTF